MNVIYAKKLFDGEQWLDGRYVTIKDGVIASVEDFTTAAQQEIEPVECLAPGYIDVHINGGGGVLFNDTPSIESLKTMVQVHAKYGTVAMVPTLISDNYQVMALAHQTVKKALEQNTPGILGVHYEGPYLSPERKGVHNEHQLRKPMLEKFEPLLDIATNAKVMVTLAPEQVPEGFIEWLVNQQVIVCIGHSAAGYEEAMTAVEQGARGFTHLFNAMSPLTSREPGVVGAGLNSADQTWCSLIADGHHIHPASMAIAVKAKGTDRILLVTDAIHCLGSDLDELEFLGKKVFRHKGKVTTADGTLAGSDLDMATAVRNAISLIGVTPSEALQMASLRPAEFLQLDDRLGRIQVGYQASLVALDENYFVQSTWIDGQKIWQL
ncbi:N-acetylglucosamine-6-phosphate deacetylase [Reinekea thalattae]|uniref:N-acetylglucosamine-6-phosphate deacetylase n=1 Tax=Reinekea thalattae TaxID=2593301 RepID=A0A5C8Z544_9GAMM|nr:N-acetylglucosamine-6-phosphate deacetylase [Reinekea thalattae]TXR52040.1 N-acetylglucosamine-6-phosphate deacetylase [Reinekea thalattae]